MIINNFIMMLTVTILETVIQHIDISGIDSKTLISELLRHAERYDKTPADLIGIINISIGLQSLSPTATGQHYLLTPATNW
ncbi:MAG: hypothetical protein ACLRXQ_02285 [Phascolarctobacterium faecium]